MTTDPQATLSRAAAMLELCPVCRDPARVTLVPDWQRLVNDEAGVIPIIGCGNPWHYALGEPRP